MKNKTLKTILEEFDKNFEKVRWESHTGTGSIKDFISSSIKDALEAVRISDDFPFEAKLCQNRNLMDYCGTCEQAWEDCSCSVRNTGYKKAITQYDEKVKKFLGEVED